MSEPETPLHAGANQQLDISAVKELDTREIEDLDLNPDLHNSESASGMMIGEDYQLDEGNLKRAYGGDGQEGEEMFDDYDDFKPQINVDSPFSSDTKLSQLQNRIPDDTLSITQRRLSLSQQSRFISYCDERLMDIQRKFVQSRGLNPQNGYSGLAPLLQDLKALVDFIWYSIDGRPNTEYLLTEDPSDVSRDQYTGCKSTYFGQSAYLIKIADDLLDYTEKFELKSVDSEQQSVALSKLFKLLFILDTIFSRLIDGTIPGKAKMSGTDSVRLTGIAERTRTRLPWYFEQQDIHGYHYEVSRIYEKALERCGN